MTCRTYTYINIKAETHILFSIPHLLPYRYHAVPNLGLSERKRWRVENYRYGRLLRIMRIRVDIPCKRTENYQCQWQVGISLQKEVADLMYSRFTTVGAVRKASKELSAVIARGADGRVLSGLYVEFHQSKEVNIVAHIHYVATLKGYERNGYGTEVIRQLWKIPNLHSVIAEVNDCQDIPEFYRHKGFRRVNEKDVVLRDLQLDITDYTLICTEPSENYNMSGPVISCSVEWFDPFLVKCMRNVAGKLEVRTHVLPNKWVACDERKLFLSLKSEDKVDGWPLPGAEVSLTNAIWLLPYNVRATQAVCAANDNCDAERPTFGQTNGMKLAFDENANKRPHRSIKQPKKISTERKKREQSVNVASEHTIGSINELWDSIRKDIEEYNELYPASTSFDEFDNTSYGDGEWEIIY